MASPLGSRSLHSMGIKLLASCPISPHQCQVLPFPPFCTVRLWSSSHTLWTINVFLSLAGMPTFSFSASQTPIHPPNLAQVCEDCSLSMVESLPPLYYLISTSTKECNSWCCIYLTMWKNISLPCSYSL